MKKILLLSAILLITNIIYSQDGPGIFDGQSDVGNTSIKGNCSYNVETQSYTMTGSGNNIWFNHDGFHFVWKKMKGDFILRANGMLLGKGTEEHRKIGWMIRNSLDSTSAHVSATVHGDGLTALQYRKKNNDSMGELRSPVNGPDVVELERRGNTYIMNVARNGELFTSTYLADVPLHDEVYIGIFICSHNNAVSEKGSFYNVRIVQPAGPALVPYRQYLGSHLELLNIKDGRSTIVYQSAKSLQAPNWMPDNKHLIYNSEGLIYKFSIEKRSPSVLNTGKLKNNNNDHVISFDGKMLGLSDNSGPDGASLVFTVPIKGGEPKQVTTQSPSYLHGWSTDGKYLVYIANRNNDYDVYRISVEGGEEERLTTAKGLDDGCEYSPDGKYIYFNSVRTGRMQIWRMKPDGSAQEQLTNDTLNNWFPHISPDGKSVIFISFGNDVKPDDHPFYKHVYLRMMPVDGGTVKVVAYLYGGQGTINTPSWSPDSKQVAFISNSNYMYQNLW